jgi:hypothetical protein
MLMFGFFASNAVMSASAGLTACSLLATRNDSSTFSPPAPAAPLSSSSPPHEATPIASASATSACAARLNIFPLSSCFAPKTDGHRLATGRAVRAGEKP